MRGRWWLFVAALACAGAPEAWAAGPARARKAKARPRAAHRHDARHGAANGAAKSAKSAAIPDGEWASAPSYRYANLGADECRAELGKRGIRFTAVDEAPGVLAPVRIPDGVGGVKYHTELPEAARATSPWEVFDCRLVLALDDFSKILTAHGVVEAITFSGWRPPPKSWPKDKLAVRHPGALAIDIKTLVKAPPPARDELDDEDDDRLVVEHDYHGQIGAESCGAGAQVPGVSGAELGKARELRSIYCEAAEKRIFTSMLSPNFNQAHFNHFHLEVTPEVKWRMVK